ncbi:MAG: PKD domain-containing protein, partial [Bacteroidota bacterium]
MKTMNCKSSWLNQPSSQLAKLIFSLFLFFAAHALQAQAPLTAATDPVCTSKCCAPANPCNCSAGVIISGGIPPYSILVTPTGGGAPVGTTACVTGLCPGSYDFHIRDNSTNQTTIVYTVTIGGPCCVLNCRDTSFCYNVPDTAIHLVKPTYSGSDPVGGSSPCFYDSIWNNAPNIYPVGTTVVKWYVLHNGVLDSCTSNVIRNLPSVYNICFTTSPPIVGGVINICNGQSITFNANCSSGISGLLWNFGNGYYSGNAVHTEPGSHYPPGTYYDTLTVYDDCGTPHDTAFQVVVDSSSGPDIFCLSVQCPGDTVTYHTSANCTGYTWTLTGGTFLFPPSATSDSCVVIWGAGPTGTLTLTVTGCTPALTCPLGTTVTIHIVPATLPVAGDTIVCSGGQSCYAVECIPGNTHSWELLPANAGVVTGNGTCEVCIQWDTAFFGVVTLQVIYNNVLTGSGCSMDQGCSHDPGCGGTGTLTINVKPIFGITGPDNVCPNQPASPPHTPMNLTNNTVVPGVTWKLVTPIPSIITFPTTAALNAYTWNAGSGAYILTAYPPAGVYCNDSASIIVTVLNMLTPTVVTGPDTVCVGVPTLYSTAPNMTGVTYTWAVSGGTIIGPSTGSSVTISWGPGGGSVSVFQTLTAAPYCPSLVCALLLVKTWPNIILPVVTPSMVNVCVKSTVTYAIPTPLLSNATYIWSIVPSTAGNIISANGADSIVIHWTNAPGPPVFVKLKISRCYDDSVMFPVNLLALPPVPNISYTPLNPCKFDVVNFSTTSLGPVYSWDFGDGGNSLLQNPPHPYTTAGDFNVQLAVTNTNGCSDTSVTSIHVDDIPVVPIITGPVDVCVNGPTSHTFSQPLFQGANYSWSLSAPALGGITSSGNNFINVLWSIPGTDTIKLHVQSTCLDTVLKFVVHVHGLPTPSVTLPSPACEGSPLTFTGSGGGTYLWSFPGGSPSSVVVPNPSVTYAVAGTYPLSLTVTNAFGCSANVNSSITVNPLPLAIISGPAGICTYPTTVTMTAVNLGGYSFVWTPTGSTSPSLTYSVTVPTTFSVVVTNIYSCTRTSNAISVASGLCDTVRGPCIVNDSIDFTFTPPICLSQTYTKIYTAPLMGWNFGDGGSAGPITPVTHTYPFPGIYPVQVIGQAFGIDTAGNPCAALIGRTHMMTIPFDAHFKYAFQCNGANQMQTIFTNTSLYIGNPLSYNWTWYDQTTLSTLSTNPFPPAQNLGAGTHVINLSIFDPATGATCTISDTLVVPVPISASFTVSSPVCQGSPSLFTDTSTPLINETSRLFNNGNFATSPASPASLVYINSGPFTATLSVTDKYGCTSTASQPVNVNPAATGTITVTPACDSVQLFSSGVGPFTWNVISPPPFPTNPVYVKTSGFYSVTSIDINGCPFTVGPVQVTVQKSPNATITGQIQYCQGENLDIKTSAAGTNFAWVLLPSTPVGGNTPNLAVIAGQGNAGTFTYQVTVTGLNGCTAVATYTINVDPVPPSASIVGGPLTFCNGDSIVLTVNPAGAAYLWSKSPAPPLTGPANTNDSLYVTASGTYSVIVYTINGCAYPAIAPVTVTVNPIPAANITGDTVLCEGEILGLTSTSVGGATYLWSGPYGTGNTNPYVAPNMQLYHAGVYSVVVTNTYGCTNSDSITVIVNPSPVTPYIIPGGVLCEGLLYNLCVQSPLGFPIIYNWNTGQMGPCISVARVGDYSVIATNQFGCTAQSNTITIHPLPDLSCVPTGCYDFCSECDSVTIPGPFNVANYEWQKLVAGTFVNYSNAQNLIVFPPGGIFRLIGSTIFGCTDSTDTLKIDFHDCCPPFDSTACKDTCVNFDNINLAGFQPHPLAPNVNVSLSNVGSQGGVTDYYVRVKDQPGASQLLAGSEFNGHWCCGTFCFDFRLFDDGGTGTNVFPSFVIRNGTLGFTFTSSTSVNMTNGWHRICAPISDCNPAPTSPAGVWAPLPGTTPADWTTVINNVGELIFKVDYTAAVAEVSGYDNICIHPEMPDISAGNDTTVCAGSVVTLNVQGCNGTPQWYAINNNVLQFINNGPIIDVQPQVSTCYVVICCGAGACCCDTDTVCVNVIPLPKLMWNANFPTVCQGAAPIYLDTANISVYINNVWTPVANAGGSGIFTGPFVTGNYFNPSTIGSYTITYSYTDSNGCTGTASANINVIFCCDTSCHVDIVADHDTICTGGVVILTATGCTGNTLWYKMTAAGPVQIGQGQVVDVLPTQNTCYMAICCCPNPINNILCCDTDIVCITVNPLPVLQWNAQFPSVCQNSAPVYLDTANISVYINNIWVPVANTGGTGIFTGPFVTGNYFNPSTIGSYTITYSY